MNEFIVTSQNAKNKITIIDEKSLELNGELKNYQLIEISNSKYLLKIENRFYHIDYRKADTEAFEISVNNKLHNVKIRTALQEKAFVLLEKAGVNKDSESLTKSPMPGLVLKILKNSGENVKKGETILILEAMKMENEIKASLDGVVSNIFIKAGQAVEKNLNLFSIK